jgi:hypothetical protein
VPLLRHPSLPQVFLDVEGPPHPSLSVDYYKGWADGLAQTARAAGVKLLPAIYGAQGDSATWTHLAQAVSNGAACEGTWIARPGTLGCHPLRPFKESFVRPQSLPQSIKVLAWQAVLECHNLDFSILNPAFDAETLRKLVLPAVPRPAAVAALPNRRPRPKREKSEPPTEDGPHPAEEKRRKIEDEAQRAEKGIASEAALDHDEIAAVVSRVAPTEADAGGAAGKNGDAALQNR